MQKLRKHHTGEELMQDFDLAANELELGDDQPIEDEIMQAAEVPRPIAPPQEKSSLLDDWDDIDAP